MPEIESMVRSIIAEKFDVEEKEVTNETSFSNDLGADSVDNAELIVDLERHFKIVIPDDEADKLLTVGDVVSCVRRKLPKGQ